MFRTYFLFCAHIHSWWDQRPISSPGNWTWVCSVHRKFSISCTIFLVYVILFYSGIFYFFPGGAHLEMLRGSSLLRLTNYSWCNGFLGIYLGWNAWKTNLLPTALYSSPILAHSKQKQSHKKIEALRTTSNIQAWFWLLEWGIKRVCLGCHPKEWGYHTLTHNCHTPLFVLCFEYYESNLKNPLLRACQVWVLLSWKKESLQVVSLHFCAKIFGIKCDN